MIQETLNPYGKFLGDKDPLKVIADTPERLKDLSSDLLVEKPNKSYAPGKWTAREILCHLADCELVFAYRLRQTIAETSHIIQPFDQDVWAKAYGNTDGQQALALFCQLRAWNLGFIQLQPAEMMNKPVTHPERGAMTFRTILETMGGHDLNHLGQLENIAAQT